MSNYKFKNFLALNELKVFVICLLLLYLNENDHLKLIFTSLIQKKCFGYGF